MFPPFFCVPTRHWVDGWVSARPPRGWLKRSLAPSHPLARRTCPTRSAVTLTLTLTPPQSSVFPTRRPSKSHPRCHDCLENSGRSNGEGGGEGEGAPFPAPCFGGMHYWHSGRTKYFSQSLIKHGNIFRGKSSTSYNLSLVRRAGWCNLLGVTPTGHAPVGAIASHLLRPFRSHALFDFHPPDPRPNISNPVSESNGAQWTHRNGRSSAKAMIGCPLGSLVVSIGKQPHSSADHTPTRHPFPPPVIDVPSRCAPRDPTPRALHPVFSPNSSLPIKHHELTQA